jgi:hypothetical protein
METRNLTLSFIFAGQPTDDFSVSYTNAAFVAIPEIGDFIDSKIGATPIARVQVTSRTWAYDSAGSLIIYVTCG